MVCMQVMRKIAHSFALPLVSVIGTFYIGSTKCIEEIEDEINEKVIICSCPVPCKSVYFINVTYFRKILNLEYYYLCQNIYFVLSLS